MKNDIPELDKARRAAMKALDDLAIGEIFSSTDMFDHDKTICSFVIERADGREPKGKQVRLARTTLEDQGFRVVNVRFYMGRTTLSAFQSVRKHGTVERCVQRLQTVLLLLEGSDELVHIPLTKVESETRLLLTQKGDRIVIWQDVVGGWTEGVSGFENLDLPALR